MRGLIKVLQIVLGLLILPEAVYSYSGCNYGQDYTAIDPDTGYAKCVFQDSEIESCFPNRAREPLRCVRNPGAIGSCSKDLSSNIVYKKILNPTTKLIENLTCNAVTLRHGTANECVVELSNCPFLEAVSNRQTATDPLANTVFFVDQNSTIGSWYRFTVIQNGFAPEIDSEIQTYIQSALQNWNTGGYGTLSPVANVAPPAPPLFDLFSYGIYGATNPTQRAKNYSKKTTFPGTMLIPPKKGQKKVASFIDNDSCRMIPLEGGATATGAKSPDYEDLIAGGNPTRMAVAKLDTGSLMTPKQCCTGNNLPTPPAGFVFETKRDFWRKYCSVKAWRVLFVKNSPATWLGAWPFSTPPVPPAGRVYTRPINPKSVTVPPATMIDGDPYAVQAVKVHPHHDPDEDDHTVNIKGVPVKIRGCNAKFND